MAAWTATSQELGALILSKEPVMALTAIEEAKLRWNAGWDKGNTEALATCAAGTTNSAVRESAALALASRDDRRALPALRSALAGRRALQAAFFLIKFQDRASYPTIRGLATQLNDGDKRVLADLLAQINDAPSVALIRTLLKNPYAGTRAHAAKALGRIRDRESVPLLIAALTDGYADVRRDAAWALAAIGDKRAIPALQKATTAQNSPHVLAHSARAAQEMARRAIVALEKGALEITCDGRGNPLGMGRF